MKQIRFIVLLFILVIFVSCNKNESGLRDEIPEPLSPSLPLQRSDSPMPPPLRGGAHSDIPDLSGAEVLIPDMVKGKWKGVTLMLENKQTHEISEHTVNLGE
ncbi:MAG: hypothetical protein ACE5HN_07540, partial [Nitrospiria bacterium]